MLPVATLLAGASVVLAYMSRWPAAVLAYAALVAAECGGILQMGAGDMIFWGAATVVVLAILYLLPGEIRGATIGMPYFATGALAGAFVGLCTNTVAGVVAASFAAVCLSSLIAGRARQCAILGFPSRRYFNYLCAKGLPLVVIFSMIGILCLSLLKTVV